MRNLPNLTQLSHTQEDELIRMLWPWQQQVQELLAQIPSTSVTATKIATT